MEIIDSTEICLGKITDILVSKIENAYSSIPGYSSIPYPIVEKIIESSPEIGIDTSDDDTVKISFLRSSKRYVTTVGRYLRRNLGIGNEINDEAIRSISDSIISIYNSPSFSLYRGNSITDAYLRGVGGSSCMTGKRHGNFVGLYEANPDKIGLVVASMQKDTSRSILWSTNKGLVHDRVYGSSERIKQILIHKMMEWNIPCIYGEEKEIAVRVEGLSYTPGEVPYMDSMVYGTVEKNGEITLTNFVNDDKDYIRLRETDGHAEKLRLTECHHCRKLIFIAGKKIVRVYDAVEKRDTYVCDNCASLLYERCNYCSLLYKKQDSLLVNIHRYTKRGGEYDYKICHICTRNLSLPVHIKCMKCGENYFRSKSTHRGGGSYMCRDCFLDLDNLQKERSFSEKQ